jgi:ubiquinone/menaquinone biosynthesis C-methylase UbiE
MTLDDKQRTSFGVRSEQFDLAATYSVLHHVPDYLHIVKEICRVLKPGGVIYIDHEVNESYFERPSVYVEFLRKARPKLNLRRYITLLLRVSEYVHIFKRLLNPRYQREGDIHVWPDDHIEWNKIEQLLASEGCEIILKQDYLLYRSSYDLDVYNEYKNKCADERMLMARKQ